MFKGIFPIITNMFLINLVDSASSHLLFSKIKPCKCEFTIELETGQRLITSVIIFVVVLLYLDTCSNSRANTCLLAILWWCILDWNRSLRGIMVIHSMQTNCILNSRRLEFLPYQLWTVWSLPTVASTGNGELGFDSGEGAWEMATTSKEGSRRANYPIFPQGGSKKK